MNQQSILPQFDVFANPPAQTMPMVGRPPKAGQHMPGEVSPRGPSGFGLGIVSPTLALVSPVAAAAQAMRQQQQHARMQGMGQTGGLLGGMLIWVLLLGAGGWLSYQAGEAMAPSPSDAKKWGWIGVPVGLLTGTLGLGIMGWVSQRKG